MSPDRSRKVTACAFTLRFSAENWMPATELLRSVIGQIQAKPGCRACILAQDATEPGCVHYREEWDCEESLRRHIRSDDFQRVLVAMDMCSEEPGVVIGEMSARTGMDYFRELRTGGILT